MAGGPARQCAEGGDSGERTGHFPAGVGCFPAAAPPRYVAILDKRLHDLGSEAAPGYGLVHLEASRRWDTARGPLRVFARVDNVLDRAHVGSVIVNDGNRRFYEPGPGRRFGLGAEWQWAR